MDKITLIAAIGKNNELGKDNKLIWHFKEDMKFFKENTMGKYIVMGRKTFESLPHLLPNRKHIVMTTRDVKIDNVDTFHTKEEVLEFISNCNEEFMIIGGASLYHGFMEDADRMLITKIDDTDKSADTFFPKINEEDWNKRVISEQEEKGIKYKHLEYKRKRY